MNLGKVCRASAIWLGLCCAAAATGCASDRPAAPPKQPYRVVLLHVQGAARALAADGTEADTDAFVPLSLTPDELEKAIYSGIEKSNTFSEIVAAPPEVAAAGADELMAAADFARTKNADLLLRVTVKSAKIRDLGNNGSTFWSTFTWFMIPLPTWFADDRSYDTNLSVEAALYDPRNTLKPTATVTASSGKQDLDLWDRGLSPWVPIIPPPFLSGSKRVVSETVTERAMAQLMDALVDELRTRAIPSQFDLTLAAAKDGGVKITVLSPRALRTLEVWIAGKRTESWAETQLAPAPASTPGSFLYERMAKVPVSTSGAPVEVRVIAEDEAGGREVRTIFLGDASGRTK